MITTGQFVAYLVDYLCTFLPGTWRCSYYTYCSHAALLASGVPVCMLGLINRPAVRPKSQARPSFQGRSLYASAVSGKYMLVYCSLQLAPTKALQIMDTALSPTAICHTIVLVPSILHKPPASAGTIVCQCLRTCESSLEAGTHLCWAFRWMLGLAALPSLLQFVGLLLLPDSPRQISAGFLFAWDTCFTCKERPCICCLHVVQAREMYHVNIGV